MYEFNVSPEMLIALIAGLLALVFDYFPGIAKWFDALKVEAKRQLNAVLIFTCTGLIFAGTCYGLFVTNLVCSLKGGFDALYIVFLAITVNQGVHLLLKPSKALKARMFGAGK